MFQLYFDVPFELFAWYPSWRIGLEVPRMPFGWKAWRLVRHAIDFSCIKKSNNLFQSLFRTLGECSLGDILKLVFKNITKEVSGKQTVVYKGNFAFSYLSATSFFLFLFNRIVLRAFRWATKTTNYWSTRLHMATLLEKLNEPIIQAHMNSWWTSSGCITIAKFCKNVWEFRIENEWIWY